MRRLWLSVEAPGDMCCTLAGDPMARRPKDADDDGDFRDRPIASGFDDEPPMVAAE